MNAQDKVILQNLADKAMQVVKANLLNDIVINSGSESREVLLNQLDVLEKVRSRVHAGITDIK